MSNQSIAARLGPTTARPIVARQRLGTSSLLPRRFGSAAVLALVVLALAACTGGGASPASTQIASPGSSGVPVASPASSPASSVAGGLVTSPDEAFAAVRARSPWFDGIGRKDPNLIGQAAWWDATPSTQPASSTDGAWGITVEVGWGGDCPAGCIDRHVWQWLVAKDGTLTLASETGPAIPVEQQAALAAKATISGIGGAVTAGPTCPVERPGDSACAPRPVKGAVLVVQGSGGKHVAQFTTDASGLFRINVPAGNYTLVAQPVSGIMRGAAPQQVTVTDGQLTNVDLSYDTGIR